MCWHASSRARNTETLCKRPAPLANLPVPNTLSCTFSCVDQVCNKNQITEVKLDLDATSHGKKGGKPETTTFGVKVPGKYVFRVSEYQGTDSAGLLGSGVRLSTRPPTHTQTSRTHTHPPSHPRTLPSQPPLPAMGWVGGGGGGVARGRMDAPACVRLLGALLVYLSWGVTEGWRWFVVSCVRPCGWQASVSYFAEENQKQFFVGQDGYVTGINWFVFYVDGATGEAKACDRYGCLNPKPPTPNHATGMQAALTAPVTGRPATAGVTRDAHPVRLKADCSDVDAGTIAQNRSALEAVS